MKKLHSHRWLRYLSIAATLLVGSVATGRDTTPAVEMYRAHADVDDQAQAWLNDLDVLVRCLKQKHPKPFFKITEQQFDSATADLRNRIPSLKDYEILVEFMKLAALLGDGHTAVVAGGNRFSFRQYPIALVWLADGVFIATATEDQKDLLGARIISIGRTPLEEAVPKIIKLSASENDSALKDKARRWLVSPEALTATGILDGQDQGRYTIRDSKGNERDIVLAPLTKEARPVFVRAGDKPANETLPSRRAQRIRYGKEWLAESKTLYCWYDSCTNLPNHPVATWCQEVLKAIDDNHAERVVLDLRRNGGGSSALLLPLLLGLKARPAICERGRLIVLIGPGTYSSAMLNALQLREWTKAVLIGQPTGGSPNEFGEIKFETLPHSKWRVQHSTQYFQKTNDGAKTVTPDLEVQPSIADYLAGRDPVFEAALRYKP